METEEQGGGPLVVHAPGLNEFSRILTDQGGAEARQLYREQCVDFVRDLVAGVDDETLGYALDSQSSYVALQIDLRTVIHAEFERRMRERGAKLIDCGPYLAELKAGASTADFDFGVLPELRECAARLGPAALEALGKAVYTETPPPVQKVNRTKLKTLRKFGEEVSGIIDRFAVVTPGPEVVRVTRKVERGNGEGESHD